MKDKDGKPIPRVEKYTDENGHEVSRIIKFPDRSTSTPQENKEGFIKVLLKLTPKHHLSILEEHYKGNVKTSKTPPDKKSFPQYLMNVEDKGELLAEELKNEFTKKGLEIRYMIEALKNQKILKESLSDLELYKSMKEYFDNEIGAYSGIFTIKFDFKTQGAHLKYKSNILKAEERIRRILEKLFPAKNC